MDVKTTAGTRIAAATIVAARDADRRPRAPSNRASRRSDHRQSVKVLSEELRRRIAALRPDWDPGAVSGFLYLEGGYSNDNYRFEYGGERYVLRAPQRPRPFVDRRLERSIHDPRSGVRNDARSSAHGAARPEIVAFDAETGHMISRWVPGTLLADASPSPAALADYLRRLHAGMPTLTRVYDPLAQARAHLERAEAPRWLHELASELRWRPGTVAPCHNDLNPWNVIRTPDHQWVTLDWEWAGRNDPLFDLVTLHQGAGFGEAELGLMAERYAGGAVPEARLTACLIAFWLRETTWALAELAAGSDRPEIDEQRRLGLSRLAELTA
jgi:thiamine kinase-like enzyme